MLTFLVKKSTMTFSEMSFFKNTLKKFKLNLTYVVVGFALEQRSLVMICA